MKSSGISFWEKTKFTFFGHILNPLWNDRLKRRRRRGKYSYRMVERYLDKYLKFVNTLSLPEGEKVKEGESKDLIYSIWFQGEESAPELVKVCFERLRDTYGDRFVVLDRDTVWNHIELPEAIKRKWEIGSITPAHFSDICRVALLYQNGGIWFDATDFLTAPVPRWIEDAELFIFLEGNRITPGTLIQSCFMRAKKGDPLLGMLLAFVSEYWNTEDSLVHYFLLHYMLRYLTENNLDARKLFGSMPQVNQDPTHTLWYLHADAPYTHELYENDTRDSFFQKTSNKGRNAVNPKPGSVAEAIIMRRCPGVKDA